MTTRNIFYGTAIFPKETSPRTPIEALVRSHDLPITPGIIVLFFKNNLKHILGSGITGLDHENQRVPLHFCDSQHPNQFFLSTTPEGFPKTPQNRLEYTLNLASDGNLTAHYTHIRGREVVDSGILGQEKFSSLEEEISDVLSQILENIGHVFSLDIEQGKADPTGTVSSPDYSCPSP